MKAVKANVKFEKENKQTPSEYNFDWLFSISPLAERSIFTDEYYQSGRRVIELNQ